MICEKCHAGQMREYERKVGPKQMTTIRGTRCDVCGFTLLQNDDDIWSTVDI